MQWTEQQQRTIDERGKNILVAAAAGSGKTAVLVERICRMVTEEDVPIDSMLIVTFTNAAAAEMKEKIRRALRAREAERPQLREQLDRMSRASISTFHAFAIDVIRTFFYTIDLEPDFSISDEAKTEVIRQQAMDDLITECFDQDDQAFYQFLDWYATEKDLDRVRTLLDRVYNTLMALPDPWGALDEAIEDLELPAEEYARTKTARSFAEMTAKELADIAEEQQEAAAILAEAGLDRLAQKVEQEAAATEHALDHVRHGEYAAAREILSAKAASLRGNKEEKDTYAEVRDQVAALRDDVKDRKKALREGPLAVDLQEQYRMASATAGPARTLQKLLLRYDQIFSQAKRQQKLLDFNDLEHFCLQILSQPEPAAFYREKFQYIFIDEYQDTSVLQETIIGRIARENNLFMVGDIKQSIYKFRLAEPEIFQRRYEEYRACGDGRSVKIDLNRNFRSKPLIIDGINDMFRPIMDGYDADAALYPGIPYDGDLTMAPQLRVINMASQAGGPEELADLRAAEVEALEVCDIIKQSLGRPYFDSVSGQVRHLQYRDIVVLMRSVKSSASAYIRAMKSQGIPLYIDDNDGYFDTVEINVFMNLLRILDNKYQDVPLISVLRSEIFGFSTEELAEIRIAHPEDSYAQAFLAAAGEGSDDAPAVSPDLHRKCCRVMEQLGKWRRFSASMPLPQFVWRLLIESGYYLIMGAMPEGAQRQANLRALVDKTEKFSENGQSSLYGFIRYIDIVRRGSVRVGQVRLLGEQENVVRIMTIHKSKGLEFPMVIVAGMGKKLTYTSKGDRIAFHKDVGLALYYEDPEHHIERPTLPVFAMNRQVRQEEMEEHIRVLYVALTRAREYLYLTGTVDDGDKFLQKKETGITGDKTFLDMLDHISMSDFRMIDCGQIGQGQSAAEAAPAPEPVTEEIRKEVYRRLSYVYPYEAAGDIRSKYSVSGLNQRAHQHLLSRGDTEAAEPEHDLNPENDGNVMTEPDAPGSPSGASSGTLSETSDIQLEIPRFLQGEAKMTAARRGTIYHGIMERIDFGRAEAEGLPYIEAAAGSMVQQEIFTEEEIRAVDLGKIDGFFRSRLGGACAEAGRRGTLHREQPFTLRQELEGEQIMIQGIIDCWFQSADGLVLLDYKTNWIDTRKTFEQEKKRLSDLYREQLALYARALTGAVKQPVRHAYLYLFSAQKLIEVTL